MVLDAIKSGLLGSRALVLITTSFPARGDGSEAAGSFVSDLSVELSRSCPVRIVAPGPETAHERWADGIEVFRFAAPAKPLSTLKLHIPADFLAIAAVLKAGMAAVKQAVSAGDVAHILALWALPSGYWAREVARATGIPYSVWTLGSDIWTLGRFPIVRGYLRRVLRDAHKCYSDGLQLAKDTHRIGRRDVDFLPSTREIASARRNPMKNAPPYTLLFLGRWHRNKGVDLLLDAMRYLNDEDWEKIGSLVIVGGGPLEATVHKEVSNLVASGRPVELRGYLPKAEAEAAILNADYLLIPSRIESVPVVYSDAMKLACPVICCPVGDLPFLVEDDSTGVVASVVTAKAYSVAVRKAIEGAPHLFEKGVQKAALRFSCPEIAARIVKELECGAQ